MEHEVDFDKYQVVALVNNKEIIVKNFSFVDIVSNVPFMVCAGILNNSWIDMAINNSNIIYIRDLSDSEKRIIRQIDDLSE